MHDPNHWPGEVSESEPVQPWWEWAEPQGVKVVKPPSFEEQLAAFGMVFLRWDENEADA